MEDNKLESRRLRRDTGFMAENVLQRLLEKLSALVLREPASLVGVEEQLQWIHGELNNGEFRYGLTDELIDVAYDIEDVIDLLILKSATQGRRRGILDGFLLFVCDLIDQSPIHMKLESIKVKIHTLPAPFYEPLARTYSADIDEESEWECSISVQDQNMANTVISPVMEKATALLAQEYHRPQVKKKVRQVQDKFSLMNGYLTAMEAVELDDSGMVWMEELCDASRSAVDVMGLFFKRREQLRRNWGGPLLRVILALDNFLSQHEFSMQMDKVHAKLLDIAARRPKIARGHSPSRHVGISFSELLQKLRERRLQLEQRVENLDFISFDDDVHALVTRLLSDDKIFLWYRFWVWKVLVRQHWQS